MAGQELSPKPAGLVIGQVRAIPVMRIDAPTRDQQATFVGKSDAGKVHLMMESTSDKVL